MAEQLYAEYPELYDAIQSEWDYDRDVSFVTERAPPEESSERRLLEVGCGTGEHTRRFVEAGFAVTAVDPNDRMLSVAHEKTTATFRQQALSDLSVEGQFDVIVAIRGVINYIAPAELADALQVLEGHLADGGVLVFDNSPLPPEGNQPALDIGATEAGHYARLVQMNPAGEKRLSWDSVVFTSDGEFFIDTHEMTPFDDMTIAIALSELDLSVEPFDGYGPEDRRTVFVASA